MIRRCRTFSKMKNPANGILNNHFGTNKYRAEGSHTRLQQGLQVVQQGQTSHPAQPRRAKTRRSAGKAAVGEEAKSYFAPYVEPLSDERTMLAGFFNSLLERVVGRGNSKEHQALIRRLGQ